MLLLKAEQHTKVLTFSFICPGCLEEMYLFGKNSTQVNCYYCDQDITEITNAVNDKVDGRMLYHRIGFPKMDRLARERTKELREKM